MPEIYELRRGILARVIERPPGSGAYRVDLDVVQSGPIAGPPGNRGGPADARAIIQAGTDGELRVAQFTPSERETSGESDKDWQDLALAAVGKHLVGQSDSVCTTAPP